MEPLTLHSESSK